MLGCVIYWYAPPPLLITFFYNNAPPTGNLDYFSVRILMAMTAQASEFSTWVYSINLEIVLISEIHFSHGNVSRIENCEQLYVERFHSCNSRIYGGTGIYQKVYLWKNIYTFGISHSLWNYNEINLKNIY